MITLLEVRIPETAVYGMLVLFSCPVLLVISLVAFLFKKKKFAKYTLILTLVMLLVGLGFCSM